MLVLSMCLITSSSYAYTLGLGKPIAAKTPGESNWEEQYLEMFVNIEHQTGIRSGENALFMVEEQRRVLIRYLEIAQKWQKTNEEPDLTQEEMYQVCEGINSVGAFGLFKGADGGNYVVVVLTDKKLDLYAGTRLFLSKKAVREVLLCLDNVPSTYIALKDRVDSIEEERNRAFGNGQGGLRSTSANNRHI
jgi:hypothetical protein